MELFVRRAYVKTKVKLARDFCLGSNTKLHVSFSLVYVLRVSTPNTILIMDLATNEFAIFDFTLECPPLAREPTPLTRVSRMLPGSVGGGS